MATNQFNKTDLSTIFTKCTTDKKLNNNLFIEFDKARDQIFGLYEQCGGQGHDAGYDAYMTGHAFLCIAKFIEIGKIIGPKEHGGLSTGSLSQGTVTTTRSAKIQ